MSEIISKEHTPWEDDEIEFLDGDWSIKRSRYDGLYDYTYLNVEAGAPVDAFQLIQWGMARVKTYEALLPWNEGEFTFLQDAEVMRDLTAVEAKDRQYILFENGKYVRCNQYYLIKTGVALPTESFLKKLDKVKPKLKKDERILWEDDKLVIPPPGSGMSIEKGARPGLYRVVRSGLTLNYSAARMKDEGLGIPVYDHKLGTLEKHSAITWKKYREELHDFWMNARAQDIKTVRDVAIVWDGLSNDPNDENLKRILEYNRSLAQKVSAQRGTANAITEMMFDLTVNKVEYDTIYKRLQELGKQIIEKYGVYDGVNLFTDFDAFDQLASSFRIVKDQLGRWREKVNANIRKEDEKYRALSGSVTAVEKPFPIACLPQKQITQRIRNEYNTAAGAADAIKSAYADAHRAFTEKASALLRLDTDAAEYTNSLEGYSAQVTECRRQKADLDQFKRRQLDGFVDPDKKPGLFCKPHKDDPIVFTTNAKIKVKKYGFYHTYIVYGQYESKEVSYRQLIYLQLAAEK